VAGRRVVRFVSDRDASRTSCDEQVSARRQDNEIEIGPIDRCPLEALLVARSTWTGHVMRLLNRAAAGGRRAIEFVESK
jgi:hypothetical protein